ncbi:hypothetical protein ACJJTC_018855 [Scirpophaga incertulas]
MKLIRQILNHERDLGSSPCARDETRIYSGYSEQETTRDDNVALIAASEETETTRDDDVEMVSAGPYCINDDQDEVEEGIQGTQSNSTLHQPVKLFAMALKRLSEVASNILPSVTQSLSLNNDSSIPCVADSNENSEISKKQKPTIVAEITSINAALSISALPKDDSTTERPLQAIENKKSKTVISPFEFRSQIKAGPRKSNRKPRKLGCSMIATDTPEKNEIELVKASAKTKMKEAKPKKGVRKVMQDDSDEEKQKKKRRKFVKKPIQSESEEELDDNVVYQESDEDQDWIEEENENTYKMLTEQDIDKPLPRLPKEGEYVLVQFTTKKKKLFYIGKVIEERNENLEYYISFLRKKACNRYHLPGRVRRISVNLRYTSYA